MEDLRVLVDALVGVAIGVHRYENGIDVEILRFFGLADCIERFCQFLQGNGTDVRAVGEAKVDQVVLPREIFLCHGLALRVVQLPGAAYVGLACVGGLLLDVLLLSLLLFLRAPLVHHIRCHESASQRNRA